jgi:hypothetical protein
MLMENGIKCSGIAKPSALTSKYERKASKNKSTLGPTKRMVPEKEVAGESAAAAIFACSRPDSLV